VETTALKFGASVPPPPAPLTAADTGLAPGMLAGLLLKTLHTGELTGMQLADRMAVPYSVLEGFIQHARAERIIEVRGATGAGTAGYRYALTDLGHERTRQQFEVSQYVGPAPVPLAQYVVYMKRLAAARGFIDRDRLADGFSHLVVGPSMLEQLGPAVNSGKSVFLYGPPGNGKTVMAEGIARAFGGDMCVPHAVEIGGQIMTLFDPVNHRPVEQAPAETSLIAAVGHDRRWEMIRRPVVVVGGELTLEMLDLTYNETARYHEAPIQLKANGGVFVIDDFGRQRISPRELLNRWIVPLESRVDFLTLHTGRKFQVPFDVLIVFATNLKPETLADEAFLRRIRYKIYAKNPTFEEFSQIFALNCRRYGIGFDPVIVEYLNRRYYQPRGLPLRACHPRDLVEQMVDLCRYQGVTPGITRELLDTACRSYFLEEEESLRKTTDGKKQEEVARVPEAIAS
jgi:hypothetical protein